MSDRLRTAKLVRDGIYDVPSMETERELALLVLELQEALERYGKCHADCKIVTYPHNPDLPLHPCTCG